MNNILIRFNFFILVLLCSFNLNAQEVLSSDVSGIKDPDGIKRMEGSILVLGESKAYDEFVIPTSRIEFDYNSQKFKEWDKLSIEGSRDTVFYRLPKDASTLEVAKSYEDEFLGDGFEVIFKGKDEDLHDGYGRFMKEVYGVKIGAALMEYHIPASNDFRYLAVKRNESDGSVTYITGLFAKIRDVWGSKYAKPLEVVTRLDVIRTKPMIKRLVLVKAEEMPGLLGKDGKVILYGILFDFNKAEIKSESEETLSEVAKFLSTHETAKLVVTGHTDNVGNFEFNRELSQKRSESVVNYLVSRHKVDKSRLIPFGASFSSPVSSNETEEGRTKNRRVELVRFQ
ncbi:MAG TPA: OmpA family protein [Oligoflexia bacterium]|nr:OmpA family protein [Oligoflexia bacterium]HMP49423.1 OmpA family protein [Oligoflexia bacterium]